MVINMTRVKRLDDVIIIFFSSLYPFTFKLAWLTKPDNGNPWIVTKLCGCGHLIVTVMTSNLKLPLIFDDEGLNLCVDKSLETH